MVIKNIHIIINPAAGKNETVLPFINSVMKEAGIKWEGFITHEKGDAIRLAKAAVEAHVDALAVYGGDGTVMEAISGLMGSEIPLAILPGGSANIMASELRIPNDIKKACRLLCHGTLETKTIDVGQIDARYFIVGLSLGFISDMINGAKRSLKNKVGRFAYLFSAAAALRHARKVTYHLTIDGCEYRVLGWTCMVVNTGNLGFGHLSLDKHIDVHDGYLDVVVVRQGGFRLLKLAAVTLLKRKRPTNIGVIEHWRAKEIRVSSTPAQTVQCDGELLKKVPERISIIPSAIKVLVPNK